MNTWQSVKNWFNSKKKEIVVVKPTPAVTPYLVIPKKTVKRKTRDNVKLTKKQIIIIRNLYKYKEDYNVSTYAEFTKFCNNELDINKSRSVYHRIIHKDGGYAPVNKG